MDNIVFEDVFEEIFLPLVDNHTTYDDHSFDFFFQDPTEMYFASSPLGHVDANSIRAKKRAREAKSLEESYAAPLKVRVYEKNVAPAEKLNIEILDETCWHHIISFIDHAEFLFFETFMINRNVCKKVNQSEKFWNGFFKSLWNGDEKITNSHDWIFKKKYCYEKFQSFMNQKMVSIMTGNSTDDNTAVINPISSTIYSPFFITKTFSNRDSFHMKAVNGWISEADWVLDMYLFEKPIHLKVRISIRMYPQYHFGQNTTNDSFISVIIPETNYEICILSREDIVVKNQIKKLFNALELNEEADLPSEETELDFRFSNLKFGKLNSDRYFIWFCNSILSWIPFPIEDVFGVHDYSSKLGFCADDDRIEKVLRYIELSKDLGFRIK